MMANGMDESKELVPEAALSDPAYFRYTIKLLILRVVKRTRSIEKIGWPIQFMRAPTVPVAAGQLDIGVGAYEETRSHT